MHVTRIKQIDENTYLITADGKSGLVMPMGFSDKGVLANFSNAGTISKISKKKLLIRITKRDIAQVQILLPIEYDSIQKLHSNFIGYGRGLKLFPDSSKVILGTQTKYFLLRKLANDYLYTRSEKKFDHLPKGTSEILLNEKGSAACKIGTSWVLYNLAEGKQILQGKYQNIRWRDPFFHIIQNGKVGLVSEKGKILLSPVYDGIHGIGTDQAVVFKKNNKYGLISTNGEVLIDPKYTECRRVHGIQALYLKYGELWGIYTYSGEEILSPQLRLSEPFPEIKHLLLSEEFGLIYQIDDRFIVSGILTEGLKTSYKDYLIKWKQGFTILDSKGVIIGRLDHEKADFLMRDLFAISDSEKWGLVHADGEIILEPIYESISKCGNNAIKIFDGKSYGLYVCSSKKIIDPKYEQIESIPGSVFAFQLNRKWGAIDENDNEILPPQYDEVTFYFSRQFKVCLNGKRGAVKQGENIFHPEDEPKKIPSPKGGPENGKNPPDGNPDDIYKWDWNY